MASGTTLPGAMVENPIPVMRASGRIAGDSMKSVAMACLYGGIALDNGNAHAGRLQRILSGEWRCQS